MNTPLWLGYQASLALSETLLRRCVLNPEKLIKNGPALIVANHQSYLDPSLLGTLFEEPIFYLARKTLFRGLGKWYYPKCQCIPVDQERADMSSLKKIIHLLKSGHKVLLFPEGERSVDGEIKQAQPGVGLIVAKARVPVQPIRIFGANKALSRGSGRFRIHPVTTTVGDPIDFSEEELSSKDKNLYQNIADKVLASIAALSAD